MSEKRNKYGQTLSEFEAEVASFGSIDRVVVLKVNNSPLPPAELDRIVDRVLAYKPKASTPKQKKRKRKAKQHDKKTA